MSFLPLFKSRAIEAVRLQTRLMDHRLTPIYDHQGEGDPPDLLAHCTACGMRVRVDSQKRTLSGEALHLPCDHDAVRRDESSAWLISQIPALMLRRFRQVLERGDPKQRAMFENGEFDPFDYSLLSRDGTWALRYEMRENCMDPISEHNPQFPDGITFLENRVDEGGMKWARYIGPRLNPNGHENRQKWLVLPLESGECGWPPSLEATVFGASTASLATMSARATAFWKRSPPR